MPVVARCPSCGSSLSETSVLALAPVCSHCHAVLTSVGGTLGMTSAYGVADPTITRRRVEADLAVFHEYERKYTGMLEACKEQRDWGANRYADMPPAPELLKTQETLPAMGVLGFIAGATAGIKVVLWTSPWVKPFVGVLVDDRKWVIDMATGVKHPFTPSAGLVIDGDWVTRGHWHNGFWRAGRFPDWAWWWWLWCVVFALVVLCMFIPLFADLNARVANGKKPEENARRQKAHEDAVAEAMTTAERKKAAEDHRLSIQIRELDGLIRTVEQKAAEVRRILAAL